MNVNPATNPIKLLTPELLVEWAYRFGERVGMLCEGRQPTEEITEAATNEANDWLAGEIAFAKADMEFPL